MTDVDFSKDFVDFLNEACSPFHAVEAVKKQYLAADFTELKEIDSWDVSKGGKYFFIRNCTTIIGFIIGEKFEFGNGFTCLGAHTDSPCFRIKPVCCSMKGNSLMLNTQPYGGGLWHTWFDRDLGLAGRVIVRKADGQLKSLLVRIDAPVARIPTLAIHLTSGTERDSFSPNLQENAKAILTVEPKVEIENASDDVKRLHPYLVNLISTSAGVDPLSVVDMELQLIDIQPSCTGGGSGEFIFSGRLDNLCSSFQTMRALIDASKNLAEQSNICMGLLFDHEEVGSSSCQGAGSNLFMSTIDRIVTGLGASYRDALTRSLRKSLVVSVDMAHALHPNYQSKHDAAMAPQINGGMVVKHNANQRYATNCTSAVMFRELAKEAGVTVQEFSVRSDSGCGSTIGPILATLSGILTVDCGSPQLSMHSIREMMGAKDVFTGYLQLRTALTHHSKVAARMSTV